LEPERAFERGEKGTRENLLRTVARLHELLVARQQEEPTFDDSTIDPNEGMPSTAAPPAQAVFYSYQFRIQQVRSCRDATVTVMVHFECPFTPDDPERYLTGWFSTLASRLLDEADNLERTTDARFRYNQQPLPAFTDRMC